MCLRTKITIALVSASIAITQAAFAGEPTPAVPANAVTVKWECFAIPAWSQQPPVQKEINVSIPDAKPKSLQKLSPDLSSLLKQLGKLDQDYWTCLDHLAQRLEDSLYKKTEGERTGERVDEIMQKVRASISQYGADSYHKGKLPALFSPDNSNSLSPQQKATLDETLLNCSPFSKYSSGPDEYFLSLDFVRQELPKLTAQIAKLEYAPSIAPCLKRIAKEYVGALAEILPDSSSCKKHPQMDLPCRQRSELARNIIAALQQNPELKQIFSTAHASAGLSTCINESDNFYQDLGKFTLALNQTVQCTHLNPGEKKLVNLDGPAMGGSPTGIAGKYQLARLPDKNGTSQYQITIRPRFRTPKNGQDIALQQHYEQEAQKCFNEYRDYFKGPNGEGLDFKISSPQNSSGFQLTEESPTAFIKIEDSLDHANSAQWNANIDCPTKIHEIMHTLGLVDEYQESSAGVLIDAEGTPTRVEKDATLAEDDCRVLGPKDSLMHSQWNAIKSLSPSKEATYCKCEVAAISGDLLEVCPICPYGGYAQMGDASQMMGGGMGMGMGMGMGGYGADAGGTGQPPTFGPEQSKKMHEQMEEAKKRYEQEMAVHKKKCVARLGSMVSGADSCPAGTTLKTQTIKMSDWAASASKRQNFEKVASQEVNETTLTRGLEVQTIPGRTSLLYPAQFRALISPGCINDNRIYYQCAKESKKTSRAVYGKDRCSTILPPECRKGGSAWLQ